MQYQPRHFKLYELVCPHVFNKFGVQAWQFFDDKLLVTIDLLVDQIGAMTVNTWHNGGKFDERGFRCLQCSLVKEAIKNGELYASPHMRGQAVDGDIHNMTAADVRKWITTNYQVMPYPIRLESGVKWLHIDTMDAGKGKVYVFNNSLVK